MTLRRLSSSTLLAVVLLSVASISAASPPQTQQSHPQVIFIDVEQPKLLDPVQIVALKFDGQELPPWSGQAIKVDENWFKDMSIVVRNQSKKTMVAVSGQVRFYDSNPRRGSSEFPLASAGMIVGRIPGGMVHTIGGVQPQAPGAAIAVAPGQQIEIRLSDTDEILKKSIEGTMPVASVVRCVFAHPTAYFDDGTRVYSDTYSRLDPSTPARFNPITLQDFYGGKTERELMPAAMRQVHLDEEANNKRFANRYVLEGPADQTTPQCQKVDLATLSVQKADATFRLVDATSTLLECGTDRATVQKAFDTIKRYGADNVCSVESPMTFQFMTADGAAPSSAISGEDCLAFDPANLKVLQRQGQWVLFATSSMASFKTKAAAENALEQLRKYGFDRECFIGRGTYGVRRQCMPFHYFRK